MPGPSTSLDTVLGGSGDENTQEIIEVRCALLELQVRLTFYFYSNPSNLVKRIGFKGQNFNLLMN